MNQQPFRLGTGGDWGFRWGPGTGDLYMEMFYNEPTTTF